MSKPSLSVVMPNYNHARFLPHALDAILSQSWQPLEIVIIDDGSTDESLVVLDRYRQRAPDTIRVIANPRNLGAIANSGRLMTMAAGDYIYFAAADDLVLPGLFEKSMRLLTEYPQAALCTSLGRTIDADGRDTGHVAVAPFPLTNPGFVPPAECRRHIMRRDFCILGLATVYHRQRLLDAGGFRPELGPFTDAFIAQALALRHGACFVNEVLAAGRWTGTNYSMLLMNPDTGVEVHDVAFRLMRDSYADAFSAEYVQLWRQRSCFNNARYLLRATQRDFEEKMNRLASRAVGVDALVLRAVGRAMSVFIAASLMVLGTIVKRRDLPRWLWERMRGDNGHRRVKKTGAAVQA